MSKKKKKQKKLLRSNHKLFFQKPDNAGLDIPLNDKIQLEKTNHSYKTFYHRRYGKYLKRFKFPFFWAAKIFLGFLIAAVSLLILVFAIFGRDLPDVSQLKNFNFSETTRIYDRDGNVLYSIYGHENRQYVPLNQIAPNAIKATIAIEDKNFYSHFGFDLTSIVRAQLKNIKEESIKEGASTITQQLAKNLFLTPERTYDRKIKELLIALEIEWYFSKDEILALYLNKIAYGSNAFGIEAASETFFNKSAKDLNLAESAILASLPKAPSYYSPYGGNKKELIGFCKSKQKSEPVIGDNEEPIPENLPADGNAVTQQVVPEQPDPVCTSIDDPNYVWGRKDFVLQRMREENYISKEQVAQAWKDSLKIKFANPAQRIEAPHFVFYIKQLLEEKYGKELVESGGLDVKTSLDPNLQSIAETVIADHAVRHVKNYGADNAGLVAIDPKTGQILAMIGSIDYWNDKIDGQVNITTSPRQPGSSFKPLIYAAAIQNSGIGTGTVLADYKTVFNQHDVPKDYDGRYLGRITIRQALGGSRNIPAIKAYYVAGGEEKILDFIDQLGLTGLRKFRDTFNKDADEHGWLFYYGWPMAIGSGEVPLLNLVSAYGAFANQGKYAGINPILEVRDRKGEIIEQFNEPKPVQVMDPQVAYIITNMLTDISVRPAGSWRNLLTIPGQNVAAKTGTSNKKIGNLQVPNNDLTIGYTPSLVAGVWVGNTNGKNLRSNAYSLYTTDPIYHDFFVKALKDKTREDFPVPEGLKWIGREVYPSFANYKNWDKMFKTIDTMESDVKKTPPKSGVTSQPLEIRNTPPPLPLSGEARTAF